MNIMNSYEKNEQPINKYNGNMFYKIPQKLRCKLNARARQVDNLSSWRIDFLKLSLIVADWNLAITVTIDLFFNNTNQW